MLSKLIAVFSHSCKTQKWLMNESNIEFVKQYWTVKNIKKLDVARFELTTVTYTFKLFAYSPNIKISFWFRLPSLKHLFTLVMSSSVKSTFFPVFTDSLLQCDWNSLIWSDKHASSCDCLKARLHILFRIVLHILKSLSWLASYLVGQRAIYACIDFIAVRF